MTKTSLYNLLDHDFKANFLEYIENKTFTTGNIRTGERESNTPIISGLKFNEIRLRVSRLDKQNLNRTQIKEIAENGNEQTITDIEYFELYSQYYTKIKDWGVFFQDIDKRINDEEVFIECIKVLIWGGIAGDGSTLAELCELQEQKNLVQYLIKIQNYLKFENTIPEEGNEPIYFSSGWTKIYSFLTTNTCIYDSRVQGAVNFFINNCAGVERKNQIFQKLNNSAETKRKLLRNTTLPQIRITTEIFNNNRKGLHGVNANLVASWIIKYISEILIAEEKIPKDKENGYTAFKRTDEIMFMLGYDLSRLPAP